MHLFMTTYKYIIFLSSAFLLISCNTRKHDSLEDHFNTEVTNRKDIKITQIETESIKLEHISSSYLGTLSIRNDSLYFADEMFCWVFIFDKDGNLHSKHLGQGRGPSEVSTGKIVAAEHLPNGGFFIIGGSWDCHHFSKNWERINEYRIGWKHKYSKQELLKNPQPDAHGLYSISYQSLLKMRTTDDHVFFPIYSQHPTFNLTSEKYLKYSRILAKMNINTGEVEKIMGRHSPEYLKHDFLLFDFFSFDISSDNEFFVCYPPDSLIYLYDNNYNIQGAFGYDGNEMDKDYTLINNITGNDLVELFETELETKGYYNWVEYIDERDLLFRSYTKGSHSKADGLQIYKGTTLIADVDVPKGCHVIGYIEPWFYSGAIINEIDEIITIYRFKIQF